jgi:hypothetical protein
VNNRDWCFMWLGVLVSVIVVVAIGKFNKAKAENWAIATIGSQHLGGGDFCEKNPGLGIESGSLTSRSLLGVYRNSLREDDHSCATWSLYAGKSWLPLHSENWRLGGAAMGIIGYESPITLAVAAVISYERKTWGANLIWFPDKRGDLAQGVWGIQMKMPF